MAIVIAPGGPRIGTSTWVLVCLSRGGWALSRHRYNRCAAGAANAASAGAAAPTIAAACATMAAVRNGDHRTRTQAGPRKPRPVLSHRGSKIIAGRCGGSRRVIVVPGLVRIFQRAGERRPSSRHAGLAASSSQPSARQTLSTCFELAPAYICAVLHHLEVDRVGAAMQRQARCCKIGALRRLESRSQVPSFFTHPVREPVIAKLGLIGSDDICRRRAHRGLFCSTWQAAHQDCARCRGHRSRSPDWPP